MDAENKKEKLCQYMEQLASEDLVLAFSGGVDSSLLLYLAVNAAKRHGKKVYAVTFQTRLHPPCDLDTARRVAEEMQAIHQVLQVDELEMEAIRTNPVNRCYLCKHHLFEKLIEFAKNHHVDRILDGTNEDDLHVYRPGIRALEELGIKSPLADCHVTKKEVKQFAEDFGISVAHRPSAPCMATRLPYGSPLDYELLERIAAGEEWLHEQLGAEKNIRLRVHRDLVRLEVEKESMSLVLERKEEITKRLHELGFVYVTLDLEGFRSGSMDTHLKGENNR
ncbi:MAG: ATP-dependent sacrificial sulfur transferase LarE [Fusicatenibacter sp.]|nr:ATP-dependent sacrificial sulfur transferase LarE [Lachnospiraceae bacterium]MDY2938193.1 ATP-dependent sacrificial sulfur transferase LarE [Fusicatenibacter sp.]